MKVRVVDSPYHSIKNGEVGQVLEERWSGTRYHVYRVEFEDGRSSLFYADELLVLGAV